MHPDISNSRVVSKATCTLRPAMYCPRPIELLNPFLIKNGLIKQGAEREIRTPVSEGQWISSPPQYQAMRSPPVMTGAQFFQESILAYSSRLLAIIARPSPAAAVANVKPGRPWSWSSGSETKFAARLTSSTNKSTSQS